VQVQAEVLDLDPERAGAARDGVAGASAAPGRVLVPVVPAEPGTPPRMAIRYPGAAFLAHLIAVDRRLPQTRPRGRTAPADAAAVYGAALKATPPRTGRRLRRSA